MTLAKAGAAAGSLMAIIGLLILVTSFFVSAAEFKRNNDLQAQLDQLQTDATNEIRLAKQFEILVGHMANLRTMDDIASYDPLSKRDALYRNLLLGQIRTTVGNIEKLGGSTEEIKLILGDD